MRKMLINGRFTTGRSKEEITVQNPATEEVIDSVPRGTHEDVDAAVEAARGMFDQWRRMGASERAHLLHEIANQVRTHNDEIVRLLTLEEGKPLPEN